MRHYLSKIKRVPFVIWYTKHELTHVLIGLVYAWILREVWGEFSLYYGLLSVIGSLIIDLDHFLYFYVYGRHEPYSIEVRRFLRSGQIGTVFKYWRDNHKENTGLATHNVYFIGFFILWCFVASYFDWKASIAFFGAIGLHLIFDLGDDLWVKGYLNDNWKHLRRRKA